MSAETIMMYKISTIIFDGLIVRTSNRTVCRYASHRTEKKLFCRIKCPIKYCTRKYMWSIYRQTKYHIIDSANVINLFWNHFVWENQLWFIESWKFSIWLRNTELNRAEVEKQGIKFKYCFTGHWLYILKIGLCVWIYNIEVRKSLAFTFKCWQKWTNEI